MVKPKVELIPTQQKFFREAMTGDNKVIAWGASIGAGKTFGIAYTLIHYSLRFPEDHVFLIAGNTIGSVKRTIVAQMLKVANIYGMKVTKRFSGDDIHISINDRKFYIFSGNDANSKDKIQGINSSTSYVDEVTTLNEEFYITLIGRTRVTSPNGTRAKVFVSFNKSGVYHWARERISENPDVVNFESTIDENYHLGEEEIADQKKYHRGTGHMERRLIENIWADATGLVYNDFTVVDNDRKQINPEYKIGLDWGPAGTTAAVLLQSYGNNWYIKDEYYWNAHRTGVTLEDGQHINGMSAKFGIDVMRQAEIYVDPSAASMITALLNRNFNAIGADNDVEPGIIATQRALRDGNVMIHKRCDDLLKEIHRYTWKETTSDGKDRPVKTDDHACDAMRYVVPVASPVYDLSPVQIGSMY